MSTIYQGAIHNHVTDEHNYWEVSEESHSQPYEDFKFKINKIRMQTGVRNDFSNIEYVPTITSFAGDWQAWVIEHNFGSNAAWW